jgi:hypothetical protein
LGPYSAGIGLGVRGTWRPTGTSAVPDGVAAIGAQGDAQGVHVRLTGRGSEVEVIAPASYPNGHPLSWPNVAVFTTPGGVILRR